MKKLSWQEIEELSQSLGEKVCRSGFVPDCCIGIASGGLIPLYLISKELGVDCVLTITASSYERHEQKEIKIINLPELDLAGKNILLIDEVAETGATLREVSTLVKDKYKVAELRTATIGVNKEKCIFRPDFVVLEENDWIVFPWEKKDFPEYFSLES